MTTRPSRTSPKKAPKAATNDQFGLFKLLTSIVKEVGIPGFIVVFLAVIFIIYGTSSQKTEFIDRFILLKGSIQDPNPAAFVVTFLVFILILGAIYHIRILDLERKEIERIGEEKSKLQEQLTQKRLRSSNK
jgi:hypothetical protein